MEYTYDAWGKVLSVTGTMASTLGQDNPFRYRGYYYDTETGFYYLQTRYYDPEVGRFLNADAIIGANGDIQGYNSFAYCSNNPVMGIDLFGQSSKKEVTTVTLNDPSSKLFLLVVATLFMGTIVHSSNEKSLPKKKSVPNKVENKTYTVYVLKDEDGIVQYVGRTSCVENRKKAHHLNPFRANLSFEILQDNLDYEQARAVEQAAMIYYHTINTANKMNNQINGISPSNPKIVIYAEAGRGLLGYAENNISNILLNWLGQ